MGTRNLIMVISQGQTKIAQYSQWDGYPEGQGATALEFLRQCDVEKFKEKLNNLRWITDEETKEVEEDDNWTENYPYLSRNAGAQILFAIYDGQMEVSTGLSGKSIIDCEVKFLVNSENFAADSLFCEWAYVIDLDKNTFEVYTGFNKEPLAETERFFKSFNQPEHRTDVYYPVKLVKSYSISELPTIKEMVSDCTVKEEE